MQNTDQTKRVTNCFIQLMHRHVFGSSIGIPTILEEDLNQLTTVIEQHRLILALYPLIKSFLPEDHPFHQKKQEYIAQFLRHQKVLFTLTGELNKQEIPYIILKGIPLNQLLYGNRLVRHSKDIDLLVEENYMPEVKRCLSSQGYFVVNNTSNYMHATNQTFIDLVPRLPHHGHEREWIEVQGHAIATLPIEINFVYLCLHAAKHNWERYKWLVDLAVFWNTKALKIDQVERVAKELNLRRSLLETERILHKMFGIKLGPVSGSFTDRAALLFRAPYITKSLDPINQAKPLHLLRKIALFSGWAQKINFISINARRSRHLKHDLQNQNKRPVWFLVMLILFHKLAKKITRTA